jgi:hypothetical protein
MVVLDLFCHLRSTSANPRIAIQNHLAIIG